MIFKKTFISLAIVSTLLSQCLYRESRSITLLEQFETLSFYLLNFIVGNDETYPLDDLISGYNKGHKKFELLIRIRDKQLNK